jgi:hypothetical protein
MKWIDNWPVIGEDKDGDGKGEPVLKYKKPNVGKTYTIQTLQESDEFNGNTPGLQWQWMANPKPTWYFLNPSKSYLRLFSDKLPDSSKNLWGAPNVLLQKFPADEFMVTTKMNFVPNTKLENEKAGLAIMGLSYANLALKSKKDGIYLLYSVCKDAAGGNAEKETVITKVNNGEIYLRVQVSNGGKCNFSYSVDGKTFTKTGEEFIAEPGRWIGAKVGIFCTRETQINDSGWSDFDWFRVEPL